MINYNQWDLTRNCIDSLLASKGVRVLISLVDNNSSEPAPDWVESTPELHFSQNSDNLGFIAGNIKAYEAVIDQNPDFVILLNNDTEVEPGMLRLLAAQFQAHPDTGLVTPAITYAEDRNVIWHAGGSFNPRRMSATQVFKTVADLPENAVEVDQISGCAMMMRAEFFKEIGYQNPDLFIYHEDIEQSLKSIQLGYKNYLVPKARVVHHVSMTVGGVLSPFAIYFTHRNRYIFASRNLNRADLFAFRTYYFAVSLLKTIIYPVKKKGNLVYWMWLAVLHGVMNTPEKRPKGLFPEG